MVRLSTLLVFINFSFTSFGQTPDVSGILSSVCDTLSRLTIPISDLKDDESIRILRLAIMDNEVEWQKAHSDLKITDEKGEDNLIEFLCQILQLDCPEFRQIEDGLDKYLLERNEHLRLIYFQTKHFRRGLEDNQPMEFFLEFLSDSIKSTNTYEIIETSIEQIDLYERNCTVTNMCVGRYGNTFRIRYSDLNSGRTMFQIELSYADIEDNLIDWVSIKKRALLEIERKERVEFNKKVEKGGIKISPPPPPPK